MRASPRDKDDHLVTPVGATEEVGVRDMVSKEGDGFHITIPTARSATPLRLLGTAIRAAIEPFLLRLLVKETAPLRA